MIYLTNIDLNKNQLMNAVIQPLAAAPTAPKLGQIYCNSLDKKLKWYDGTSWKTVGIIVEKGEANGTIVVDGVEMTVYELPIASTTTLGGMIVGSGLSVDTAGKVSVDTINDLTSTDTTKPLSAAQGKFLKESVDAINSNLGNLGGGDMLKSVYDMDGDGIVDNAAKLGGHLPEYYAPASSIPSSLSQLSNDEGFIKSTVDNLSNYYKKTETYNKDEVNQLIGDLNSVSIEVVDTLPAVGETNIIYLVPREGAPEGNIKEEYIYSEGKFELIGTTEIDLSPYAKTSELSSVAFSNNYEDLDGKPSRLVAKKLTISAGSTTASAQEAGFSGFVCAYDASTGEGVICDWEYAAESLVVEISEAQPHDIVIIYNATV